jgi:hypothetical protein
MEGAGDRRGDGGRAVEALGIALTGEGGESDGEGDRD